MSFPEKSLYDVFLSHTARDKNWVRLLGERLESEKTVDGSRNIRVFFDEWDIDYSENIVKRLNDGLSQATYLAAVLSPEFLDSGWANLEWTHWVARDPRGANLIGVLLRDTSLEGDRRIELPAPFLSQKYFDFREPRHFEAQFAALLNKIRGIRLSRGRQLAARYSIPEVISPRDERFSWDPDDHQEVLFGNMLRVVSLPTNVSCAPTKCEKPADVWGTLGDASIPCFLIRGGQLWTFSDLHDRENPLRNCVTTEVIKRTPTKDWIANGDRSRYLIALLNQLIHSKLKKIGMRKDDKGRFYFKANSDGTKRMFVTKGDRARQVCARCLSKDGGSSFFVHASARIKCEKLGEEHFLSVDPGYVFTQDGVNPLAPLATLRLTVQWSGAQRNDSIFRDFMFWVKVLSQGEKEFHIDTGGEPVTVSGLPETTKSEKGLDVDQVRIGSILNIGDVDLQDIAEEAELSGDEEPLDEETDE